MLIPSWAFQDILLARRLNQTVALADSSTSFAEAAVKVSASSCSFCSARGYKPCNSNHKNEYVPAVGTADNGLPFLDSNLIDNHSLSIRIPVSKAGKDDVIDTDLP